MALIELESIIIKTGDKCYPRAKLDECRYDLNNNLKKNLKNVERKKLINRDSENRESDKSVNMSESEVDSGSESDEFEKLSKKSESGKCSKKLSKKSDYINESENNDNNDSNEYKNLSKQSEKPSKKSD